MRSDPHLKSPSVFTVISTCPEFWGGSEELWSGAACALAERGHSLSCFKTALDETHPRIRRLKSLSCAVRNLRRLPLSQPLTTRAQVLSLALHLTARRPDMVVISQGDNYDGLHVGYLCRKLRIPYTLISQKATDHFWPPDRSRLYRRDIFQGAARCFFVSEHNRRLTEEQIGATLTNAEVVRNPYLVSADEPLPWPGREDECLRLACVARLYVLDKGQDILLRVLAREKWKNRNLHVSFFGRGINAEALADLATKLAVRHVSFEGQTEDVPGIWKNHHALILPSRAEGLPLALVEAMMCGRPAVVTKVGGNAEVIDDHVTGFLAAPAEDSLDAALEEAWARRRELSEMGQRAAVRIRELVSPDPAEDLANKLIEIVCALAEAKSGRVAAQQTSDPAQVSERMPS